MDDVYKGIDLSQYEKMYDEFDNSHNRKHLIAVRERAVALARIYATEIIDLAYISATLHDIGLIGGKEDHEKRAVDMILADKNLVEYLGEERLAMVVEAVKEHRATKGKPLSILAKIVSDSDRISSQSTSDCLNRSYFYQLKENESASEEDKLMGAAKQVYEKFGPEGPGRRTYFKETSKMIDDVVSPILEAYVRKDVRKLREILDNSGV